MKTVDFFSGSQSFSRWARSKGFQTWTLDMIDIEELQTDFVGDYMDFDVTKDLPYIPDIVWASPDCAAFSIAAGNIHFAAGSIEPKTEKAEKSIQVVKKLHSDLLYLTKINPKLRFFVENPVGKMQWLPFMRPGLWQPIEGFRVIRVDQCAFGRKYRKATHIFTNDPNCKDVYCAGSTCDHVRGKDGVQNAGSGNIKNIGNSSKVSLKSGYWKRAMIPPPCLTILF